MLVWGSGMPVPAAIASVMDAQTAAGGLSQPIEHNASDNSFVLDSNGNPVISYWVDNPYRDSELKLARCSNPTCTNNVSIQVVDSWDNLTNWGASTSLELDSNSNPVISYISTDATTGSEVLTLAHCNDLYCAGGDESIQVIDRNGPSTSSLKLDSAGNPVIAYEGPFDFYGFHNQWLKLVHCNDPDCAGADESIRTVYSEPVFWNADLVLDEFGNPVISFTIRNPDRLGLAHCTDPYCAGLMWIQTFFEDPISSSWISSEESSLVLDSNGNPVISYVDWAFSNRHFGLVHCNDPRCTGADEATQRFNTTLFTDHVSLTLDGNGNPVIGYIQRDDQNDDAQELKLMHCNDPYCAGADESVRTVIGYYGGNPIAEPRLALDSSGNPVLNFIWGQSSWLYVAVCGNASCDPSLNVQGGGTGSGTMTASGIACSSDAGTTSGDCSEGPGSTNTFSVVAVPNPGSMFTWWEGCTSISTTNPAIPRDTCNVTLADVVSGTIRASFGPVPTQMHIEAIEPYARIFDESSWTAEASILILGNDNNPVSGVTVTGRWSPIPRVTSCVTNYNGLCSVGTAGFRDWAMFTVTNVAGQGILYNPAANVQTSVTICKVEGGVCE